MTVKLALLAPLALVLACGGTTDGSHEGNEGGTGAQGGGGKNGGGSSNAGSSNAGTANGGIGAVGAGGSSGGVGGTGLGGVGAGGALGGAGGSYNPSCPAHVPTGACFAPGVACDYNYFNGCLCQSSPDVFTTCTQVDPTCTAIGGAGAGALPLPFDPGSGGISAKVALPPQQRCVCQGAFADAAGGGAGIPAPSGSWNCSQVIR
jgi:hypothetical protein